MVIVMPNSSATSRTHVASKEASVFSNSPPGNSHGVMLPSGLRSFTSSTWSFSIITGPEATMDCAGSGIGLLITRAMIPSLHRFSNYLMNTDFALIDAAFARAFEGLRVLDEMARFVFKDEVLFKRLKTARHALQGVLELFGPVRLLKARSGSDVGGSDSIQTTPERFSSWELARANAARTEQALRELEEMSVLYAPAAHQTLSQIRYDLYQLEKELLVCTPHYYLRNYFENGTVYCVSDSVDELVWLIEHGATVVQLRDKQGSEETIFAKAQELCDFVKEKNKKETDKKIIFIINDFVDVAAELPVAGVHIGQDVEDIAGVRQRIGSNKIIGRSNRSVAEMRHSLAAGADYVSIGPVFATPTKPDRTAVGIATVREAATNIFAPWVAIGGLNPTTTAAVYEAGGKNIAVVRSAREFFI